MSGTEIKVATKNYILSISGQDSEMMVMIEQGGNITYGPGYDPDKAAQIFWQSIANSPYMPHCVGCNCQKNPAQERDA